MKVDKSLIISFVAAGGVIGTALLAIKANEKLKAIDLLEIEEKERTKKKILACAPVVLMGIGTIACIFSAHAIMIHEIKSLSGLYSIAAAKLGEKRAMDVELPIVRRKKRNDYDIVNDFKNCDEEKRLFYDNWSNRYFYATISEVLSAESAINHHYVMGCIPCINDLYDILGLPHTEFGRTNGWTNSDGNVYWIDFQHTKVTMDDGLECWILDAELAPGDLFLEDYCLI